MKIVIGCDHAAFEMKEYFKGYLAGNGHEIIDVGTDSTNSVDYPEFGHAVAEKVVAENCLGIAICGSGIGISIAANKVKGARCALCTNCTMARLSRQHNNAQILAIGARIVGTELATQMVDAFLETEFEGGRHDRRVNLIEENI